MSTSRSTRAPVETVVSGLDDPSVVVDTSASPAVVVRPRGEGSLATLRTYLTRRRAALFEVLHGGSDARGAVVLRGWEVAAPDQAEALVYDDLAVEPLTSFGDTLALFGAFNERAARLGVAPDGVIQRERSRTVPVAKEGLMQPPHTEFGLGPHRPRVGAFYCAVAPADSARGTTALCDLGATVACLSEVDRHALASHAWWNPRAGVPQPWLLDHPESGRRVLGHLYCLTDALSEQALHAYQAVRSARRDVQIYPEVVGMDDAGNDQGLDYGFQLVGAGGRPFDMDVGQARRLLEAAFANTAFFRWEANDLLLFDNLLFAHWRMPGAPDRQLHAFFGAEVDVRSFCSTESPAFLQTQLGASCRGGNALILDTLGLGGRPWALRALMALPDPWFVWAGRRTWARAS